MKEEQKTDNQTKAYFLFHEWIAQEMNNQGITLDKLVVEIQPKPTKNALHEVFKAILYSMYQRTTTKGMTRKEMNNCLDVYMDALSRIGVHIDFPDSSKQNLLQFY